MNRTDLIHNALKETLTSGAFIDTKFLAFSRRGSTGGVERLKAVYANSQLLRANCQHFAIGELVFIYNTTTGLYDR